MLCRSLITLRRTNAGIMPRTPCGQCLNCRLNRRDRWTGRLLMECLSSSTAQFWTLTLNDESMASFTPTAHTQWFRNFREALQRSEHRSGNPNTIRCFGVLEWGTLTGRPHYHVAVFNHLKHCRSATPYRPGLPRPLHNIGIWPHGHVDIQDLNAGSARYLSKYTVSDMTQDSHKPLVFHVRKPCLGLNGLRLLIEAHSRSPIRHLPFEVPVTIGERQYDLDQTMRSHCWRICKDRGISSSLNPTTTLLRQRVKLLENSSISAVDLQHDLSQLRKEQLRDELYAIQTRKNDARFDRALLSAYAKGMHSPPDHS